MIFNLRTIVHLGRSSHCVIALGALLSLFATGLAAADPASGWRGNGTGIWTAGQPPLVWSRVARGALEGLRSQPEPPADAGPGDAPLVERGLPRAWLYLGPLATTDTVHEFERDPFPIDASLRPTSGASLADRAWTRCAIPADDRYVFGNAELPWLDLGKQFPLERNQFAYAHTYLYSPRGGAVRMVIAHSFGAAIWLNGQAVYRQPTRKLSLGYYSHLGTLELANSDAQAGRAELQLQPGWNRLLVKLTMSPRDDWRELRCTFRLSDGPDVPYESRNIRWMTELPGRSTSTPILVGDYVYLTAEPDELLAIHKQSGQIAWRTRVNLYEALPAEQRAALPALAQRVDPLWKQLDCETDRRRRVALRSQIDETLKEIDPATFRLELDGHFSSHFGIVGYTMPTPVSDGQSLYVFHSAGVAACYDLGGQRRWITRIAAGPITYGSSPALAGGVLACFLNRLHGLDARTGALLWTQPRVQRNIAAVLGVNLAGQAVFVTQRGDVVRPADGRILYRLRGSGSGDEGWSPPVVLDSTVFLPKYGVNLLHELDFRNCTGDDWMPEVRGSYEVPTEAILHAGQRIDRWTAGSPLVWRDHFYQVDIYQRLYVMQQSSRKLVDKLDLPLDGFTHYNAVAVAASPTFVAGKILVCDNQGHTGVLDPGPPLRWSHMNVIGTQLDRDQPLPAQETLAYAPPIVDGERLYLRGERYLYCIARDAE